MKKVLILTASFGEGHNAAARGIRDGIGQIDATAKAEIRDLFAEVFGPVNDLARYGYLNVINRVPRAWGSFYSWLDRRQSYGAGLAWLYPVRQRLRQIISRDQPEVVVSVYPAYPHLLDHLYGPARNEKPKRVICITDSISVNAIWFRCSTDHFILANEETAEVVADAGIPRQQLRVLGFPVNPEFAAIPRQRSFNPPWRLLYMVSQGQQAAIELVRELAYMPDIELTVTVGRDENLWRELQGIRSGTARKFRIIGWTTELPRLLCEHHVLISKAGGATVQEAIAAACPVIINQVVPGQEAGNAQLVLEKNCGALAIGNAEVLSAVRNALRDEAGVLCQWMSNISQISRPRAALEIAEFLLTL